MEALPCRTRQGKTKPAPKGAQEDDMKATKTVEWTLKDGRIITAEITAESVLIKKEIDADGIKVETSKKQLVESTNVICSINGQVVDTGDCFREQKRGLPAGIVARLNKVIVDKSTWDKINKAQTEAAEETRVDEEIKAYLISKKVKEANADKAEAEYRKSYNIVKKAMEV